jgi:hypothetical protein
LRKFGQFLVPKRVLRSLEPKSKVSSIALVRMYVYACVCLSMQSYDGSFRGHP